MSTSRALRIIRASAVYDLVVTALFALPFTARFVFDGLAAMHDYWGLGGVAPASNDVFAVMFANLMGSIVVVWAVFRIVRPSLAAGVADTAARLLFSLGMATALVHGASPMVAVLLAFELAWALVQGFAVVSTARESARVPKISS